MNRIGRWLYLAALCQLLAGPLMLGGLSLLCRQPETAAEEPAPSLRVAAAEREFSRADVAFAECGSERHVQPSEPRPDAPGKPAKDTPAGGKSKLWLIAADGLEDEGVLHLARARSRHAWRADSCAVVGVPPPTPPPRGV